MTIDLHVSASARPQAGALLALADTVEKLAGAADAVEIAAIVRTAARLLAGADGVCVVLREGERVTYLDEDAVGPLWKGQSFPIESCISGWAMRARETVIIPDITADPRIVTALYANTFVKSLVMAPTPKAQPVAAIGAYWAKAHAPGPDAVAALEAMARAAGVALENVRLRTALTAAAEEARAADQAKSAFLANMSHEIRTPLHGMTAVADVLATTPLEPRQREMVALIARSADHLNRVLSDVLDFSRIEAGRLDLAAEPFDPCAAAAEVAALFQPRANAKGLTLDLHCAPGAAGSFVGDAVRFRQILSNLVSNAIRFTAEGGVALRVEEEDRAGARSMLAISVADSGVGFAMEEAPALFRRFTQIDGSLTRARDGSGLGLAITDGLVRAMGGTIEARSRPGFGATFTIRLPLDRAPPTAAPLLAPAAPAAPAPTSRRLRILCAEDHPTNQAVLRLCLEPLNAEIVMVEDGARALESVTHIEPDLILMDMQMPVLDGLETTRRIRAIEQDLDLPRTPIIMVTANALKHHLAAAFAAGVDAFVSKPTTPSRLIEAIDLALEARAA